MSFRQSAVTLVFAAAVSMSVPAAAQRTEVTGASTIEVLQRSDVHCVHVDEVGFAWLCTDEGLVRFDGHQEVAVGREAGPLRAMVRGTDGRLWAGGPAGLYELVVAAGRDGGPRLRRVPGPAVAVNALITFQDRSIGATTTDGVMRLSGGALQPIEIGLPLDPAARVVNALVEDESRAVWAGASSGLYLRTADGQTRRFTTADGLPDDGIRTLAIDAAGRLWAGTPKGLALIYRGAIERRAADAVHVFTADHGLPAADIRALHRVKDALWIGTSRGAGVLRTIGLTHLDLEPRLAGAAARAIASNLVEHVWLTTDTGVHVHLNERRLRPRAIITSIRIDGRSEPVPLNGTSKATVRIPWSAKLVEVEFSNPRAALYAHHLTNRRPGSELYQVRHGTLADEAAGGLLHAMPPSRPRAVMTSGLSRHRQRVLPGGMYVPVSDFGFSLTTRAPKPPLFAPVVLRRMLGGEPRSEFESPNITIADSTGWLTLPRRAERRAVIENPYKTLDAGAHRFVVYAAPPRRGPPTIGEPAIVEFTVLEPLWVRWWLMAPVGVAVAALVFGYRQARARQRAAIARVQSRIAADLHDSVGASLSRIALLSDVVRQQAAGQLPLVIPAASAIGENARAVIDEMNDAVWFINPAVRDVSQMLVRLRTVAAALFEPDGVTWRVEAAEPLLNVRLSSDARRHVYLIIKEALTNARRHAHPSSVTVRLTMAAAGLRIEVEDDGAVAADGRAGNGNGIGNMQARAAELGGTLVVEPRTPGPGTRVVLQTRLRGR